MDCVFRYVFFVILICMETCFCYNVLVVFPEPTRSHGILGHGYVRNLLKADHSVTYVTPFPWKEDVPEKLTQIDISSNLKKSEAMFQELKENFRTQSKFLLMLAFSFARLSVEHPNVQRLLRDPANKFDVVVAEWIDSEIYSGFAAVYGCPLVWSASTRPHWQSLRLMDEYPNPAYSADVNSDGIPPFSFASRMRELWIQIEKSWILFFSIYPMEVDVYNLLFKSPAESKGVAVPPHEEVAKNYAVMLFNSHPTIGTVWRLPPNMRDIGGYHIETPTKPLSEDLQSIMDDATEGVVYFSMGSTINAKDMPTEMKAGLVATFGKLNQTVIWKMEEALQDLPKNVHLLEWAPQTSLLAHPNMRVFITHAGQLSVTEAVHFGVPMITLPRHGDQFANAEAVVRKGVAIRLDYNTDLPNRLGSALDTILKNSSYKDAMLNLSEAYHDRPVPPGSELVYWVEHVVRTRGAPHLRSPALMAPWYQKIYLELAAIILSLIILIIIIFKVIWWSCKKMNVCYC